jgi:glycosyltransferase involved in cell wall biosynthesis
VWSLLTDLAKRHWDWSFVFVGPLGFLGEQAKAIQELTDMPNTYFLGAKPITALPAYTQHLDVCMLSYQCNDYTKFIYPLKLHECLAGGRPVVGSPIRTLRTFRDIITLAQTADQWSEALAKSLDAKEQSPAKFEQRRQVAREYDWDSLVHVVAKALC